jgi:DNA repair exonuclease SbcCD ATPase subunit
MPRFALTLAFAAATLGLIACSSEDAETPEVQIQEGLDQAESAIEKMRDEKDNLVDRADQLQEQLSETASKQVNLYKTRLDAFTQQITELPAEQEAEFSNRLQQLRDATSSFQTTLEQYTEQGTDAAADAWQKVQDELNQLKESFDSFTQDLNNAAE